MNDRSKAREKSVSLTHHEKIDKLINFAHQTSVFVRWLDSLGSLEYFVHEDLTELRRLALQTGSVALTAAELILREAREEMEESSDG